MAAASAEADFGPLHGGDIKPVAVALTIVSGIILILRFWSRALIRGEERKVGPDDWMALIAWVRHNIYRPSMHLLTNV